MLLPKELITHFYLLLALYRRFLAIVYAFIPTHLVSLISLSEQLSWNLGIILVRNRELNPLFAFLSP